MTVDAELTTLERLLGPVHEAHPVGMMRVGRCFDDHAHHASGEGHISGAVGDVDVADDLRSGR